MCPHIFFRLSLSSFIINTLKTNYLTSFSLTILTLCVIIFLKTVIIFSPITTALISHFCAANAIVDWHFSQNDHPFSEHFHAIFSQENPIASCFWGAWLLTSCSNISSLGISDEPLFCCFVFHQFCIESRLSIVPLFPYRFIR